MRKGLGAAIPFVVWAIVAAASPAESAWAPDGVPLCLEPNSQYHPAAASDGAGGAIVAWDENRSGTYDLYVQRVDAVGTVSWFTDGLAICTATGNQQNPRITADGVGGAIIAWMDGRGASGDIYAQHITGAGAVQWTADGLALCAATGYQQFPQIVADGAGGAVVAWQDSRSGNPDVYAQRVNAAGGISWIADGYAVCTDASNQGNPALASDGWGGGIVVWDDARSGNADIYAQRVRGTGAAFWTSNGVAICTASGSQTHPQIVGDEAGGAVMAWLDLRTGDYRIYAQRVNAQGTVLWASNGVALCTAGGIKDSPRIAADGSGGAIVTWQDYRSGEYDVYAQRVNAAGVVQWATDGVAICTVTGQQDQAVIVADGAGGAIILWRDSRDGSTAQDIRGQHVNGAGVAQWTADGMAICSAADNQTSPTVAADGAGGVVAAWGDLRTGVSGYDIFAQSTDVHGRLGTIAPTIHAVRDVPGDQGGKVYVSWDAARPDLLGDDAMSHYSVWRAISTAKAARALAEGVPIVESPAGLATPVDRPPIRVEEKSGVTSYWEFMDTVDALYMPGYGKAVATLFDSTAVCDDYHYFQIVAHTADPRVFWVSAPDSGYSVDNLAPATPKRLAGARSPSPAGLGLTWSRNREGDLVGYRVYRGLTENFVPDAGSLIASPRDTLFLDEGWSPGGGYYYKVSARDVHGNESGCALLRPEDIAGADNTPLPKTAYLAPSYPNPFNPQTTIRFGLPEAGAVQLAVYDQRGRQVRVIVDGEASAGEHRMLWDGRDGEGRILPSGTYVLRLVTGQGVLVSKVALIR